MIAFSTTTALVILLAVLLGAILTLSGFALGALVVYRTKREPHERLFGLGQEKGDAFVVDDFGSGIEDTLPPGRDPIKDDPVPSVFEKASKRFLEVYNTRKAGEGK